MTSEQQLEEQPTIEERIFIGNIDYKTKRKDIAEFLEGFEVESIEIPTTTVKRGEAFLRKRMGFAFATLKTKEEAQRAVDTLDQKVIHEREIVVKPARAPSRSRSENQSRPRRARKPKAEKANNEERVEQDEEPPAVAMKKVPLSEGIPSKDTVVVKNLDEETTVTELREAFADLQPEWVRILRRNLPLHIVKKLKREEIFIKHKGIAFIRFVDEPTQKKAIEMFNGKEIKGRTVQVSVAIDSKVPVENGNS